MISDAIERSIIGETGLALVPESFRDSMFQDSEFLNAFGLSLHAEGIVGFPNGMSLKTTALFDAVMQADRTKGMVAVCDEDEQEWHIRIDADDKGISCPHLLREGLTVLYPEGTLLISDQSARERRFREMADDAGLLESQRDYWMRLLWERALTHIEMGQIHRDLEDTPHRLMRRLRASLRGGEIPRKLFVPESRRYHERLIGKVAGADNVREHAESGAQELITELIVWSPRNGLSLSLPLASQSAYSAVIPIADLPDDAVRGVYDALVANGDMLSRLAAVEIGLPLLLERTWLADPICDLVDIIRTEDPCAGDDGFSDLSRLFILADSEISRLGILRGVPYFYRRAASFAQATLIQRQLNVVGADLTDFRKWIDEQFGPRFYAQSLVDMRLAPRWHPELIDSVQLKQEFIGRILGAAEANKEQLRDSRLAALLLPTTEEADSLVSLAKFPRPYFSGPLEGNFPPPGLPEDAKQIIDEQLSLPELTAKCFIGAVNLANIYAIETELTDRIAERLKNGKYHFHEIKNEEELEMLLPGLAVLAAVTRSHELADDVQILVRKYRRDPAHKISITTACRTVFFAAAAYEDIEGWCGFVGAAVEDLTFGDLSEDEAGVLQGLVLRMCEAEPELWTRIGAAEAALSAYIRS